MAAWERSSSANPPVRAVPKDFLSIADWSREEIERMLARAAELKALRKRRVPVRTLEGCSILLYFAKPSLRTFVTFEVGVVELGGFPVYLPPGQVQIGEREPPEDVCLTRRVSLRFGQRRIGHPDRLHLHAIAREGLLHLLEPTFELGDGVLKVWLHAGDRLHASGYVRQRHLQGCDRRWGMFIRKLLGAERTRVSRVASFEDSDRCETSFLLMRLAGEASFVLGKGTDRINVGADATLRLQQLSALRRES